MPPTKPISLPSGYAPAFAIGFSDQAGGLAVVDTDSPLPVDLRTAAAIDVQQVYPQAPTALEGTAADALTAGPFAPVAGRPVYLTLSGAWTGEAQVLRSIDGGTTMHALTAGGQDWGTFTANACEPVWQEQEGGAALYLSATIDSGTLEYRMAQ